MALSSTILDRAFALVLDLFAPTRLRSSREGAERDGVGGVEGGVVVGAVGADGDARAGLVADAGELISRAAGLMDPHHLLEDGGARDLDASGERGGGVGFLVPVHLEVHASARR